MEFLKCRQASPIVEESFWNLLETDLTSKLERFFARYNPSKKGNGEGREKKRTQKLSTKSVYLRLVDVSVFKANTMGRVAGITCETTQTFLTDIRCFWGSRMKEPNSRGRLISRYQTFLIFCVSKMISVFGHREKWIRKSCSHLYLNDLNLKEDSTVFNNCSRRDHTDSKESNRFIYFKDYELLYSDKSTTVFSFKEITDDGTKRRARDKPWDIKENRQTKFWHFERYFIFSR